MASLLKIQQALAAQAAIDATLALLTDAETGRRGFILTGDDELLAP